jgi:ABC-2 type transport system ATP-binding protein
MANQSQAVLELVNVSKFYGERKAVCDISLTVNAGEIFGFIGPNGAGKTTTIKLIVGLASLTCGEIKVCGYDLKKNYEEALRNIGGIIENPELYGYLTGRQNLDIFAGLYPGITEEDINAVIKLVKLENRIDDKVRRYSLGMKQRLGLAQSLLHNPKLLILDEPTNGLDPYGIRELRDLLKELAHKKNITVFISSHILSEMQLLCDRAAIIDNGKLVRILSLKEINDYALNKYIICTSANEKASRLLNDIGGEASAGEQGDICFNAAQEDVPKIIEALVRDGIGIYYVKPVAVNLESAFIGVTKESQIK